MLTLLVPPLHRSHSSCRQVTFAFLKCFSQYVHPELSSTIVISSFINHGLFVKPSMNAKPMLDCLKFAGTNLCWFMFCYPKFGIRTWKTKRVKAKENSTLVRKPSNCSPPKFHAIDSLLFRNKEKEISYTLKSFTKQQDKAGPKREYYTEQLMIIIHFSILGTFTGTMVVIWQSLKTGKSLPVNHSTLLVKSTTASKIACFHRINFDR